MRLRLFVCLPAIAALALACTTASAVESASELLEKGIYAEETVGDLNKAVEYYGQAVAKSAATESAAAEAQYRLGNCLLKQKKETEAIEAFRKLVADYPAQKDWVAKAKKHLPEEKGLTLEQAPWKDGEFMQLDMRLGGGVKIGSLIWTVNSAKLGDADVWAIKSHRFVLSGGENRGVCDVWADKKSFAPIKSEFRHLLIGNVDANYSEGQVTVKQIAKKNDAPHKESLEKTYYDNEQGVYVFRMLPLKVGFKATVPIYVTFGGGKVGIPVEVVSKETVETPAGKFECFKMHLGIVDQDFWFSADENRYLVKLEANGVTAELERVGVRKASEKNEFAYADPGFTVAAPDGWFFFQFKDSDSTTCKLFLIDPLEAAKNSVYVSKLNDGEKDSEKALQTWADGKIAEQKKTLKNFRIRPDSREELKIGENQAICVVIDYGEGKSKRVLYWTFIMGSSAKAQAEVVDCLPEKFDAQRVEMDKIIETIKLK